MKLNVKMDTEENEAGNGDTYDTQEELAVEKSFVCRLEVLFERLPIGKRINVNTFPIIEK